MRVQHNLLLAVCLAAVASAQTPKAQSTGVFVRASNSYLGVAVVELDDERARALKLRETRGVEVKVVDEDSPASKAGIKEGDVILDYNGQRVEGTEQFVRMVSETPVGRKFTLAIWRNGGNQTLTGIIGSRPRNFPYLSITPVPPAPPAATVPMPDLPRNFMSWHSPAIGIETESLNSQLAEYFGVKDGVLVRFVGKKSAAENAGLKAGDVITKVDGNVIHSSSQISSILHSDRSRKSVPFTVVRNHKEMTVEVPLEGDLGSGNMKF